MYISDTGLITGSEFNFPHDLIIPTGWTPTLLQSNQFKCLTLKHQLWRLENEHIGTFSRLMYPWCSARSVNWVFPKCFHYIRWIQWQKCVSLHSKGSNLPSSHLLGKRPKCYHSTNKTHVRDRIFKLSPIHASVIYQIPWICWIQWIPVPFREFYNATSGQPITLVKPKNRNLMNFMDWNNWHHFLSFWDFFHKATLSC